MVGRCGGDADDLAAQPLDEWAVFRLGVNDDNVIRQPLPVSAIVRQRHPHHLLFCHKGLSGAGHAQHKSIAVEQLLPVGNDEVLADDVLAVVDATPVPHLLGLKGHEDSQGLGGQGAQGVDSPQAQGQDSCQAVRLLPAQGGELAQVLAGDGLEGVGIAVQLLLGVRQMHQSHHSEHHPLVAGGQVVQHLPRFLPLLLQIVRHHRGEVAVAVLPSLPVG